MAGGGGNSGRGECIDKVHPCLHRCYLFSCPESELLASESFKHRRRAEADRTCLRNVNLLREDISRLLYSNLDLSQEEELLVELVPNIAYTSQSLESTCADDSSDSRERSIERIPCATLVPSPGDFWATPDNSRKPSARSDEYGTLDASPVHSDMADSGLETGSASPRENTISERSVADLDESQTAEDVSTDEDSNKATLRLEDAKAQRDKSDATCSSAAVRQQLDSSGSSDENAQRARKAAAEVARYEKRALNEPFCESGSESDENGRTDSFVPTESFEFVDPVNASSSNSEAEKESTRYDAFDKTQDEKLSTNCEARSMTAEELRHELSHSNDLPIKKSSSSASGYYFIDASTLNDESEVVTRRNSARVPSYVSNSPDYVPSRSSDSEDRSRRCAARKSTNPEPDGEPELADEKRGTEKESLVVEIKEADSGESAQASPCPDNGANDAMNEETTAAIERDAETPRWEIVDARDAPPADEDAQKPSLIRRNTFELDSNDEKLSLLRQEYERRQGDLVFRNSIQQYSGHRVDGDSCFARSADLQNGNVDAHHPAASFLPVDDPREDRTSAPHEEPNFTGDELSEKHDDSLPVTLSCSVVSENRSVDASKRLKRGDEMTPIVSGGASTSDYAKLPDSPSVRRKTESTPIVSGGSVIMKEPLRARSAKPTKMSTSMTAWVVDMSDCQASERDARRGGMSQSFTASECAKRPDAPRVREKHGSLGFFVDLNNVDSSRTAATAERRVSDEKREANGNGKQYCEFFVDMSAREGAEKKRNNREPAEPRSASERVDRRNIFSMFIDLSDAESSSTLSERATDGEQTAPTVDATREPKSAPKPGVFMFIESDSPVVRRRTLSSSRPGFKRHSWNVDKSQSTNGGHAGKETAAPVKEHKRAHSLSVDRGDLRKLQTRTSNSSHSLSEVARADPPRNQRRENARDNMDTSGEDVFEFDARDTPPNSHIEIVDEELRARVKRHDYKELIAGEFEDGAEEAKAFEEEYSEVSVWDKTATESTEGHTRKSETFDISSGSGPSPGSDNREFELSELLNGDAPRSVASKINEAQRSLSAKFRKIECELKGADRADANSNAVAATNDDRSAKETATAATGSTFVRLSDLDQTPLRSRAVPTVAEERMAYRMSSSIPETSWIESKLVMTRSGGSMRTIPRGKLAPAMTTSLPPKRKSPLEDATFDCEGEGVISESDLSSLQSSMGRSGAGSTEETETSSMAGGKPYNRLGEDLLRMFLEEINPDVTIDVGGRHIRAHKCILSSRCQYFAAILSGGWVESAGNVISIQGYSYNAVHFALCHIYSGESDIPDSISIVELATLADMLCLEGLKEIIGYTLKVKYCHLFHKPCQICAVGVLECMPLAAAYGLDEVYRKSLRWITKHFVRIWPCKAFATLPRELMEKCYHQHIVHMSTDNVLQTTMDCDKLLATLPNVRWAEPVFRLVSNLLDTSVKFLSDHFSGVLGNEKFQALGRELTWNISRLEDNFLAAADRLPPEQACKSYAKLSKMVSATSADDATTNAKWGSLFLDFLRKIQSRVEKCLVRDAARAARTAAWLKMDLELRRRVQELACLVILPYETSKRPSRHSNFLKEARPPSSRSYASRSLDLKRVKMVISEHNDKTLKQTAIAASQAKKAPPPRKPRNDLPECKAHEDKPTPIDTVNRPKSWPNKTEVKSRYLEPRNRSIPKEPAPPEKLVTQQRRKIMISSSDSSRTSSPAMKRAAEKKPLAKNKLPVKKDAKALSSDSLAESNAERAGGKKDSASKSCGVTRPESPSVERKDAEVGLSVDSLSEPKKKPAPRKKPAKMDASMSADSLTTEISATPRSGVSNKLSPTLGRVTNRAQASCERTKKASPPMAQRSPLTITRRPPRSLECSTAASRNRAVAVTPYQGSPNLRRNLLDAAKTPDGTQNKTTGVAATRANPRPVVAKRERREVASNQYGGVESPSKRSFPKSNVAPKTNKSTINGKRPVKGSDEKVQTKCHNGDSVKQLTVGSRSGTFLKDEPTILKRADIKSSESNV